MKNRSASCPSDTGTAGIRILHGLPGAPDRRAYDRDTDRVEEILRKEYQAGALSSTLYLVSTPIGNYDDITLRALNVLKGVDFIICEEFKTGNRLLRYYGFEKPLEALNEHNEASDAEVTVDRIKAGADAALISDAGTPVLADPGAKLVHIALKKGVRVVPVPGASSLLSALVVCDFDISSFHYAGFLPRKKEERVPALKRLSSLDCVTIIMEAPYRFKPVIEDCLASFGRNRRAVVAVDMTMPSEQVIRGTLGEINKKFDDAPFKAEFVMVIDAPKKH
ncbi:MAG: 16S rRNA (cytidine(1402)-2'-O)-methyltransferase [Ignavibacteriae bacterium 37-53-5]|nr:MAG: 16S rRNA (cytidine(1402)-2'-O)-methyltransferase [Ignavibacteriae bacterium 37-53-5]